MMSLLGFSRYIASITITVNADLLILMMGGVFIVFILILRTNYNAEESARFKVLSYVLGKLNVYQWRVRSVAESLRRMSNENKM